MRTPFRLVGALVGAVLLAACGSAAGTSVPADVAATVNGTEITVEELESEVRRALESPQFAEVPEDQRTAATEQAQAQTLSGLIQRELIEAEIDRRGIEVSDQEVQDLYDQEAASRGGQEQFDAFLEEIGLTDQEARDFLLGQLRQDKLREEISAEVEVTEDEVREAFEQQEATLERVDTDHILLDTREEAEEVKQLLAEGADFATLAEERSTGPSGPQGGDLGSVPTSQLVPEYVEPLRDAQPGDIVGPVETQFGFHVIQFNGFETPSFEDMREDLETQLRSSRANSAIQEFLAELNAGAEVEVNSRFGEWDPQQGAVVPADQVGDGQDAPATDR